MSPVIFTVLFLTVENSRVNVEIARLQGIDTLR